MGQLLVRNLDDAVIEQLKAQATERGTSLEQIARDLLSESAARSRRQAWFEEVGALRSLTTFDPGWDGTAEIRRDRDALAEGSLAAETGTAA